MTFEYYLEKCNKAAYQEPPSDLHRDITEEVLRGFLEKTGLKPPAEILDIGSGPGYALEYLVRMGWDKRDISSITILRSELDKLYGLGFDCSLVDMHEIGDSFVRSVFDSAVARHVLEHSPVPGFVLAQIHEVLKPSGWLYMEVPAGGTCAKHEGNKNHLSILHDAAWKCVLEREGFEVIQETSIRVALVCGEDRYLGFIARRQ